jgi:hypothetical protein
LSAPSRIGRDRKSDKKREQRKVGWQSEGSQANCSLVRSTELATDSEA